jgi:hypothetical protein
MFLSWVFPWEPRPSTPNLVTSSYGMGCLPREAREQPMAAFTPTSPLPPTHPTEHLTGAVERVTFHSEETGFCVLRVKVRGHRDLVTVVGTAATITPGEYIEG